MAKKKTPKDYAVDEAKLYVKILANWTCEKCGKTKYESQMHGAHIMPVTYSGTAAEPFNLLCLCAGCHSMGAKSAHQNPVEFTRWLEEAFPGRYDKMKEMAYNYSKNPRPKRDWIEIRKQLKSMVKKLKEEQ